MAPGCRRPFGASPGGGSSATCIDPSRLVCPTVATALAGTMTSGFSDTSTIDMPAVQPSSCRRCRRRHRRSSPANSIRGYRYSRARRGRRRHRHPVRPRQAAVVSSRPGMRTPMTVTMTLHPIASRRRRTPLPDHGGVPSPGGGGISAGASPGGGGASAGSSMSCSVGGGGVAEAPWAAGAGGGPGGGP